MPSGVSVVVVAVERILALRHRVLRQGLPADSARFPGDLDPGTVHLAALAGEEVVGCASYLPSPYAGEPAWQLRGMATAEAWRGRGVGGLLLAGGERHLAGDPIGLRWCNARVSAIGFYERHGWTVDSEEFAIPSAGPHRRMVYRRPPAPSSR
jgi:GNAT superfamily N-acetyltransferase